MNLYSLDTPIVMLPYRVSYVHVSYCPFVFQESATVSVIILSTTYLATYAKLTAGQISIVLAMAVLFGAVGAAVALGLQTCKGKLFFYQRFLNPRPGIV